MAKGKKSSKDKPSRKRYIAEGRKKLNKLRRLGKTLKRFLKLQALAAKLGKKTKVGKCILEVEKAIEKIKGG